MYTKDESGSFLGLTVRGNVTVHETAGVCSL